MRGPRIALCLWSFDNDYQRLQREDCHRVARRYDAPVEEFSAHEDPERQATQIRELLAKPPDVRPRAILVHPVQDSRLITAAREASSLGIGWVVLNRNSDYLEDLRNKYPQVPLFCVKPDQQQVGRIQGKQFRALLPEGGELFYIQGPLLVSAAEARFAGVKEEIRAGLIKLVTFRSDWTTSGGKRACATWIQTVRREDWPRCLVGAQNDEMAMGARQALCDAAEHQARPEMAAIRVTGCDGLPNYGQRLVRERHLAATVVIPPTAGKAVEQLIAALDGAVPIRPEIVLSVSSFPDLEQLEETPTKSK
jgi:ABC-type sugar transport system substrate-binding protein